MSWQVWAGETLAIVGESDSGKSVSTQALRSSAGRSLCGVLVDFVAWDSLNAWPGLVLADFCVGVAVEVSAEVSTTVLRSARCSRSRSAIRASVCASTADVGSGRT